MKPARRNLVADEYRSLIRAHYLGAHPKYLQASARWLGNTVRQYSYAPAVAPTAFPPNGDVVGLLRDHGISVWLDGPVVRLRVIGRPITETELIREVFA